MEETRRKREQVRKDKVETIPQMLESGRAECWIPKKICFWGGEFETAVAG
jgi:hypothetical protein